MPLNEDGGSSLSALDLFQEIDQISFEEHQQYIGADRGYAECFFVRNGPEEEKEKGPTFIT